MNKIEVKKKSENGGDKLDSKDVAEIKKFIKQIEERLSKIDSIISDNDASYDIDTKNAKEYLEGEFDGRFMVTEDDKYLVPENYASKSKLVEGDRLKLVIAVDGTHVYKQISPIDRIKKTGVLEKKSDQYFVESEGDKYQVLKASVTYFKIEVGDKVTIIVPKDKKSKWAVIENKIG